MRLLGPAVVALIMSLGSISPAGAHPLGNFSVNRYSRIQVGSEVVQLRYVLDLAEIPTLQELNAIGAGTAGLDDATRRRLLESKVEQLKAGARLEIDDRTVVWAVQDSLLELLPGQADLSTMRVTLLLTAAAPATEYPALVYRDTNYSGRVGWHEVVLQTTDGASLLESTVSAQDQSNELREYPEAQMQAPLGISSARARLKLDAGVSAETRRHGDTETRGRGDRVVEPWNLELETCVRSSRGASA